MLGLGLKTTNSGAESASALPGLQSGASVFARLQEIAIVAVGWLQDRSTVFRDPAQQSAVTSYLNAAHGAISDAAESLSEFSNARSAGSDFAALAITCKNFCSAIERLAAAESKLSAEDKAFIKNSPDGKLIALELHRECEALFKQAKAEFPATLRDAALTARVQGLRASFLEELESRGAQVNAVSGAVDAIDAETISDLAEILQSASSSSALCTGSFANALTRAWERDCAHALDNQGVSSRPNELFVGDFAARVLAEMDAASEVGTAEADAVSSRLSELRAQVQAHRLEYKDRIVASVESMVLETVEASAGPEQVDPASVLTAAAGEVEIEPTPTEKELRAAPAALEGTEGTPSAAAGEIPVAVEPRTISLTVLPNPPRSSPITAPWHPDDRLPAEMWEYGSRGDVEPHPDMVERPVARVSAPLVPAGTTTRLSTGTPTSGSRIRVTVHSATRGSSGGTQSGPQSGTRRHAALPILPRPMAVRSTEPFTKRGQAIATSIALALISFAGWLSYSQRGSSTQENETASGLVSFPGHDRPNPGSGADVVTPFNRVAGATDNRDAVQPFAITPPVGPETGNNDALSFSGSNQVAPFNRASSLSDPTGVAADPIDFLFRPDLGPGVPFATNAKVGPLPESANWERNISSIDPMGRVSDVASQVAAEPNPDNSGAPGLIPGTLTAGSTTRSDLDLVGGINFDAPAMPSEVTGSGNQPASEISGPQQLITTIKVLPAETPEPSLGSLASSLSTAQSSTGDLVPTGNRPTLGSLTSTLGDAEAPLSFDSLTLPSVPLVRSPGLGGLQSDLVVKETPVETQTRTAPPRVGLGAMASDLGSSAYVEASPELPTEEVVATGRVLPENLSFGSLQSALVRTADPAPQTSEGVAAVPERLTLGSLSSPLVTTAQMEHHAQSAQAPQQVAAKVGLGALQSELRGSIPAEDSEEPRVAMEQAPKGLGSLVSPIRTTERTRVARLSASLYRRYSEYSGDLGLNRRFVDPEDDPDSDFEK